MKPLHCIPPEQLRAGSVYHAQANGWGKVRSQREENIRFEREGDTVMEYDLDDLEDTMLWEPTQA